MLCPELVCVNIFLVKQFGQKEIFEFNHDGYSIQKFRVGDKIEVDFDKTHAVTN